METSKTILGILAFVLVVFWGLSGGIALRPTTRPPAVWMPSCGPTVGFRLPTSRRSPLASPSKRSAVLPSSRWARRLLSLNQHSKQDLSNRRSGHNWTARVTLEPKVIYELWEGPESCPVYLHSEETFESSSWMVYGWGKFFLLGLFFFAAWAVTALIALWADS